MTNNRKIGEMKMSETEKAIENLNTAKLILCNQQMLTPEMCIRIGQAVTDAIALLKEHEQEINFLKAMQYQTVKDMNDKELGKIVGRTLGIL